MLKCTKIEIEYQINQYPIFRMILKDLETTEKVMKKEPEETPPSSVDASPLQVKKTMIEVYSDLHCFRNIFFF